MTILRTIQSLLDNIKNQTQTTHIQISVSIEKHGVAVDIKHDDNNFIDAAKVSTSARQNKPAGSSSIQEQINLLGGKIKHETQVKFWAPIET